MSPNSTGESMKKKQVKFGDPIEVVLHEISKEEAAKSGDESSDSNEGIDIPGEKRRKLNNGSDIISKIGKLYRVRKTPHTKGGNKNTNNETTENTTNTHSTTDQQGQDDDQGDNQDDNNNNNNNKNNGGNQGGGCGKKPPKERR